MNHRTLLVTVMVVIFVLTVSFSQTVSAAPQFISKPGDENWDAVIGATGMNNFVSSLAVYQGKLYAGGGFSSPASYIAQWDGTSWTGVDGGMDMPVNALITDGTYLYAGGGFTSAGSCTDGSCGRIARWNGTAWSPVGGGFYDGEVLALAIDDMGNLYAGGTFNGNVAVWNGTVWWSLDSGPGGWVYALAVDSSGNLYAGGGFNTNDGGVANYLAVWDGSSWAAVDEYDAIDNQVYRLLMDGEGNLVVGGSFSYPMANLARRSSGGWDSWGGASDIVQALEMDSCGGLYVGGNFTSVGGGQTAQRIAYFDGDEWTNLGNGISGTTPSVQALAFSHGALFAGGTFSMSGNATANNIALWSGRDCVGVNGSGSYTLYEGNLPVGFEVNSAGNLAVLEAQRYNMNHPSATDALKNGAFWLIEGFDSADGAATGFNLDLTLPTLGFSGDGDDKVCRYNDPGWDCALDSYTASSLTRNGVTSLSFWTVGNDSGPTAVRLEKLEAISGKGGLFAALAAVMVMGVVWRRIKKKG